MLTDDEFTKLIDLARAGDESAATEIVRIYEPEIRRAARLRLTDPDMRRIVDSMDIAQSVFGRLFQTVAAGSVELHRPDQLLALLTTMTRNRIIDEHRRQQALKRNGERAVDGRTVDELSDETPGPRTTTITKELLDLARSRMSAAELHLAERRCAGESWNDISRDLGEPHEALRKRLERAFARVRDQFDTAEAQKQQDS